MMKRVVQASVFASVAASVLSCGGPQVTQTAPPRRATHVNTDSRVPFVIAEAQRHTHDALDVNPLFARAFLTNVERGYRQAARDTAYEWSQQVVLPGLEDTLVEIVDNLSDPDAAASAALACAERYRTARDVCMEIFYDAVLENVEGYGLEPIWITADDVDRLEQIHGNSSVLFKVKVDGHTVAAFKPWQEAPLTNVRGEIASYRLCQLIDCAISVPQNREAWIGAEDFMALTGVSRLEGNAVDRLEELTWFDGDDGPILYGTQKEWVPGFTSFPLEMTEVWLPLVDPSIPIEDIEDIDVAELLAPFATLEDISYAEIVERTGDMTAIEFARQLSDLHVFDLLINNFDRYQLREWGRNVQWNHEQFISLDNGASFQNPEDLSAAIPARQLRPIGRFSRSMIFALRNMDLDRARAFMFPESPYFDDDGVWAFFLERRQMVLDHVDGMVERYGYDAVLSLP